MQRFRKVQLIFSQPFPRDKTELNPERGQPCPREPKGGDSPTRLSALRVNVAVLFALCGCSTPASLPESTLAAHEEIRERAETVFDRAQLYKPVEVIGHPLAATFSPLLLLEAPMTVPGASGISHGPGRVEMNEAGGRFVPSAPKLYCHLDTVSLAGIERPQITWLWFHPLPESANTVKVVAQGVRITLDSQGRPVIWEVLGDPSGLSLISVAQSLETLAAQEHGPPLPGRRFAVESGLGENPGTVVASVISDAPAPMGPIIHLRADTFAVEALICRCMPAQVRELAGATPYELAPLAETGLYLDAVTQERSGPDGWAFQPGAPADDSLAQVLRLPSSF